MLRGVYFIIAISKSDVSYLTVYLCFFCYLTKENAVGLLENMTDFITSQASAEGQDVDLVQNIGGNLLQGMSNSLSTSAKKAIVYEEPKIGQVTIEDEDGVDTVRRQVTKHFKPETRRTTNAI